MLPLPLAPLLTPMPGCWARLVSIVGCEGCEVEPLAPPDTPAPVEAGGVTTDPVGSYVERPPRQELFQTFPEGAVRSYVRPFCAVIDRWPR